MIDLLAAQTVIRAGEWIILQRKTAGYPLANYVGRHCLVGGAWTKSCDRSPRETAWRELLEELRPASALPPTPDSLRHLGNFELKIPCESTGTRSYCVWNFVFELTLPARTPPESLSLTEGEIVLVPAAATRAVSFAWGHGLLLHTPEVLGPAGDRRITPQISGEGFRRLEGGEPPAYTAIDMNRVRFNPLRTGDIDDAAVFETNG